MPISGREAALKALIAYRRSGARSDIFLNDIIGHEKIDSREASLAYRLTLGVLQNTALCDYYIAFFLSSGIDKLQPVILDILRLSVYQIAFLTKIPKSAAVNEGVELAKKYTNRAASGLVNAVLRRASENSTKLPEVKGSNKTELLSIKYSHPKQLVDYLINRLGIEGAELFLASNNDILPITIRVNKLKTTADKLAEQLTEAGIAFESHEWMDGFFYLRGTGSLEKLKLFEQGLFTVQDTASALAVMVGEVKKGSKVLDCCAAPGGKTFFATEQMQNSGCMFSCDLHEKKLRYIKEGAARLGIDIISCASMDATKPEISLYNSFDTIICDVPCSGFGVIAKKPEIRYKSFDSIKELPKIQLSILQNVSKYLKKDGILVYSTCTVLEEENEGVIKAFLAERDDFETQQFSLPEPIGKVPAGYVTLWPHIHHTDGFFICKLKKMR